MTFKADRGTMGPLVLGGPLGTVRLRGTAGVLHVRDGADTAYRELRAGLMRANNPTIGPDDGGAVVVNGVIRHGTGVQSYGIGNGAVVGNARGVGASDLQASRTLATQVASGKASWIPNGRNNAASSTRSVAAGDGNSSSKGDAYAFGKGSNGGGVASIAAGSGASVTAQAAAAMGLGTVASARGALALGDGGIADTQATAVLGSGGLALVTTVGFQLVAGRQAAATHQGELAVSGGRVAVTGDASQLWITWGGRTTNAAATNLSNGTGGGSSFNVLATTSYAFRILLCAHREGGGASSVWLVTGVVRRAGGAPALVGAPVFALIAQDAALVGTAAAITISGTALAPSVTGLAGTNIKWTAAGRLTRILV